MLAFGVSLLALSSAWAGVPTEIGFTIRQHGATPLGDLTPLVEAGSTGAGSIRVEGEDSGPTGHYAATLTLPSPGRWTWGIRGFGDAFQPMPPLQVLPTGEMKPPSSLPLVLVLVAAGGTAAFGLFLLFRRRLLFAAAALGLSVVLGVPSLFLGRPAEAETVEAAPSNGPAAGEALFVAKGCIVCHVHDAVPESRELNSEVGPELTSYRNAPEFLRLWLSNPAGVRPKTGMPDLDLSGEEIEALIGFLNQEG